MKRIIFNNRRLIEFRNFQKDDFKDKHFIKRFSEISKSGIGLRSETQSPSSSFR